MRCHSGQYDEMVKIWGKNFSLIEEKNSPMFFFFFFFFFLISLLLDGAVWGEESLELLKPYSNISRVVENDGEKGWMKYRFLLTLLVIKMTFEIACLWIC